MGNGSQREAAYRSVVCRRDARTSCPFIWARIQCLTVRVQQYMMEMIEERRYIQDEDIRADLFSLLMGALDDEDAKATDRELTGKCINRPHPRNP